MNELIHMNHFHSHSGRTWPSWPEVCRPQLQTSSVVLGQTSGAEHPRWWWWVWHPDHCHEVENCVSHLLLGGSLPHHWGDSVQRARAATWEFPKAGHSGRETGLLDHARLCELFRAGGFGQGRLEHQHNVNNSILFCTDLVMTECMKIWERYENTDVNAQYLASLPCNIGPWGLW